MNKKIGFVKKSDLFLCKKKNKIFVKSIRSVLWIKKNWICKENQICFYVKERIRFLLKGIRSVCKVKKGWFYQEKSDLFFFFYVKEKKKKRLFEKGSTFMR